MEQEISSVVEENDKRENHLIGPKVKGNCFLDDSSDEDDFMVTIGEIRKTPSGFSHHLHQHQSESQNGKADLNATPLCNDVVIYDLDLASMVDKPWEKTGANIADYFNYGFNEGTWNQYCERQKKFRAEFVDQNAINRAILDGIHLAAPSSPVLSSFAGGRQLLRIVGEDKPQPKIKRMVIPLKPLQSSIESSVGSEAAYVSQDCSEIVEKDMISDSPASKSILQDLYKPPDIAVSTENILNTVDLSVSQNFSSSLPFDFSKPPPIDFTKPPPMLVRPTSFENSSFTVLPEKNVFSAIKAEQPAACFTPSSVEVVGTDGSTFPISTVCSSSFQEMHLNAPFSILKSIVDAPPGLDEADVPAIAPIPDFPTQFKKEWLKPSDEAGFLMRKRSALPERRSEKKHKRLKREEEKLRCDDDRETAMASLFHKAFVCKQENSLLETKDEKKSQDTVVHKSEKKIKENLLEGEGCHRSDKKHKKSRTSQNRA